jgi:hypothetical protein
MPQAEELQVTSHSPDSLSTQPANADPVAKMLATFIEKGVTADNVNALEKMCDLYERMQDRNAQRQFTEAFVALQAELPVIVATSTIPNRGKYEKFEDVMRVVSPLLVKHGFTVSFSMDFKDTRVLEICTLKHIGGHSQSNSFAVRTGRADSDTQADCKAATTAKRNALLNCLNIVIRQDAYQNEDSDASLDGSPLKPEQVLYLKELIKDAKPDMARLLAFAGAASVEEIGSARYDEVVAMLHKKLGR